ncbi:hypothetical protein SDRG_11692 [Saprolegnia diclina VS20]|uniref:Methyltransferase domain-containing protein n=1 Tax=Saprolegnia diclina (strain VS20) TaxID=1156394 RepID=T0RL29_SAPDV|nr:hypothetical protein SDRG_11692 [Saprolegnia diclina VS20]EQC30637.1 hypothetical protein SDRG_11692 [Saprolegnia diclina VS20]|eukprot:XP_008615963.1 hypothetical protein SDRG_11692 [Saprolegnia diclina VS20]
MTWWVVAGAVLVALVLAAGLFFKRGSATPAYMSASYWDARYRRHPEAFEWYLSFQDLVDHGLLTLTSSHLSLLAQPPIEVRNLRVLDLGGGNSTLAHRLCEALHGNGRVVSIDISDTCIRLMQTTYPSKVQYLCMDARDMEFKDNSFDVVLDKSTMDAIVSPGNATAAHAAKRILRQVARVLRPDGFFLMISVHPWSYWHPLVASAAPSLAHAQEKTQSVVLSSDRHPILVFVNVLQKASA